MEEMMWKQRSRVTSLKHEYQNTRYFHRKATWRTKKNKIKKVKRDDASFAEQEDLINFGEGVL
jgi:hypothetical protein